ncbi:hypothetical protein HZS_7648 [Henneguya salminicola]|nr:hypothetical protein HZS_7648 [Henneguya salminicola]
MAYFKNVLITELPSYNDLLKLVDRKNSGLIKYNLNEKIPIESKYIGNVKEGVLNYLNSRLLIYDDYLDGQFLAYDTDFTMLNNYGMIHYQDPRPFYAICTTVIMLRLNKGDKIKGMAKMISKKHCCTLVYGCVQASVRFPEAYNDYVFSGLSAGTQIRFRITETKLQNCTITLYGVLSKKNIKKYGRHDPYCSDPPNVTPLPMTYEHLAPIKRKENFHNQSKKHKI